MLSVNITSQRFGHSNVFPRDTISKARLRATVLDRTINFWFPPRFCMSLLSSLRSRRAASYPAFPFAPSAEERQSKSIPSFPRFSMPWAIRSAGWNNINSGFWRCIKHENRSRECTLDLPEATAIYPLVPSFDLKEISKEVRASHGGRSHWIFKIPSARLVRFRT